MRLPAGRNLVVFIGFDLDVDSAEALRGEDPATRSRGVFAVKRGVAKILDVLARYSVKATFFVPGWVARNYPETVYAIVKAGHEVAGHGYAHERLDKLTRDEERLTLTLMVESLKPYGPVKGFRAPYWRLSPNTFDLLASIGIVYDSSLMDDEEPYVLKVGEKSLVELPVDWRLDDWPYMEHHRTYTVRELVETWLEELEDAARRGGYVSLTMHPQCVGRGARVRVLEEVVRRAIQLGAWMPTGSELASYMLRKQ